MQKLDEIDFRYELKYQSLVIKEQLSETVFVCFSTILNKDVQVNIIPEDRKTQKVLDWIYSQNIAS